MCGVPGVITCFMGIYRVICGRTVLSFNSFGGGRFIGFFGVLAELQLSGHHD